MINAVADAQVELYYNNNGVFETIERGIKVENGSGNSEIRVRGTGGNRADMMILQTGTANANIWLDASNGDLSGADYANIFHNNSTLDLEFINYAADIILKVRGGSLGSGGLRTALHAHENGAVDLYHNGAVKFKTKSYGAAITTSGGNDAYLTVGVESLNTAFGSKNAGIAIGDSDTGIIQDGDGRLEFWCNNAEVMGLTSAVITSNYRIEPGTDNALDLGSSTRRWRYIYTTDLQLSNENTRGNEVDGTEGTWTLQEGEDDVYMINRKNGKRYIIKMEEV